MKTSYIFFLLSLILLGLGYTVKDDFNMVLIFLGAGITTVISGGVFTIAEHAIKEDIRPSN